MVVIVGYLGCVGFNGLLAMTMRFCRGVIKYQLIHKQHGNANTNRRTFSSCYFVHKRQAFACFLSLVFLVAVIIYNYMTSSFYLSRLKPSVGIQQVERSTCCLAEEIRHDMCGRKDCLWPCPASSSMVVDDEHLRNERQDKAFFIESTGYRSSLNFRQSCAVESLALINPNLTVHLLMTGGEVEGSTSTMQVLASYPNIHVTRIRLGDYIANTPLEQWYFCTDWYRGWYAVSHLSDGLRFLTLSKYGGYYFDLDVIQLRPVTEYRNFVVAEDIHKVGSSVIHTDRDHEFIRKAVQGFHTDYKWYAWAHNGPDLLTRTMQSMCDQDYTTWMTPERCKGFGVLPYESFYPIYYLFWRQYFYQRDYGDSPEWGEETIGAHVWNSFSGSMPVQKSSNQYYTQMARKFCPKTFAVAPVEF